MLRHLRVTNFSILSDVTIELGSGLNVLTGETGAGKSLIVEAVNLLRGGRASADIPRTGAEEAVVEAIVAIPVDLRPTITAFLDAAGLPRNDDEVFIRRVIARGGRSRTYVNGALTTAAKLAELGGWLVDLSGQHEHQGLIEPRRHLDLLDALADNEAARLTMTQHWDALGQLGAQVAQLQQQERNREQRLDYLRFALDEFDTTKPEANEDAALELERQRLVAVDQLATAAGRTEELLYGGDSAHDLLARALRELERAAKLDPRLEDILRLITEAKALIGEAAHALRHYADRLDGDPARLAWVEDRLASLKRLMRKHGGALTDVVAVCAEMRKELDSLVNHDAVLAQLQAQVKQAEEAAQAAATVLHEKRQAAAQVLEREVGSALAELAMSAAALSVQMHPRDLGPQGADTVEFFFQPNQGEAPKPLAKVASGGELSRIMLAIKLVLRTAQDVATYIFDEVDTGIGGATAQVVGKQIRAVATHRQVLCVTHLPQIAAFADHHFLVEKSVVDGRTETHVSRLSATARKDELARMLGGQATAKARAHAAELLLEANRVQPTRQPLMRGDKTTRKLAKSA